MNRISIFVIVLLLGVKGYSQSDVIQESQLNFATLIVDYDTYQYEGGEISYFPYCGDCTSDSIPFIIDYDSPGDFGGITYSIQNILDTVFDATIIWMGTGHISIPESFGMDYPFAEVGTDVAQPSDFEYYSIGGLKITDSASMASADSAWTQVQSLAITNLFAEHDFKAAAYLYGPTVGAFDPSVAKWVIWLFYNDKNSAVSHLNNNDLFIGPNPAADYINLTINQKSASVEVLDLSGKTRLTKTVSFGKNTLNISQLEQGVYLIKVKGKTGFGVQKFVKL